MKLLSLPFSIGYHYEDASDDSDGTDEGEERGLLDNTVRSRRAESYSQDGYISALVLFLTALSVTISVSAARWMTSDQSVRITDVHVNSLLVFYMLTACACMWVFLYWKSTSDERLWTYVLLKTDDPARARLMEVSSIADRVREIFKSGFPLIGVLIFFTLGLAQDILGALAQTRCMDAFYACGILVDHVGYLVLHVTRIAFEGTLVVFVLNFYKKQFKRTRAMRYCMMAILLAVISVLIDITITMTYRLFPPEIQWDIPLCPEETKTTLSDRMLSCIVRNDSIVRNYAILDQYFHPIHMQYALIVIMIVQNLCSSSKTEDVNNASRLAGIHRDVIHNENEGTDQIQLSREFSVSTQLSRMFKGSAPKCLIFCLILNVVKIVFLFLLSLDNYPETGQFQWHLVHEYIGTGYFLVVDIVCMIGFMYSRKAESNFIEYTDFEIWTIYASIFSFGYICLSFIAKAAYILGTEHRLPDPYNSPVAPYNFDINETIVSNRTLIQRPEFPDFYVPLSTTRLALNLIQYHLQIPLMMHTSRIKFLDENARNVTKECILFIAICNFVEWLLITLTEVEKTFIVCKFYYGDFVWNMFMSAIQPAAMFYRFNSCVLLFKCYFSLRHN